MRVWHVNTGAPLTPAMQHGRMINHVSMSKSGRYLLVSSANNHARLWDAARGEPVTLPLSHGDQVFPAVFSPDESEVLTGSGDFKARVFVVSPAPQPVTEMMARAQLLSSHRLDSNGALVPLDAATLSRLWHQERSSRK